MVKELQVINSEAIDELATNHKWGLTFNIGFSSIAITLAVFLFLKKRLFSTKKDLIISPAVIKTNATLHTSMPELSEVKLDKSSGITRISHIPYF